ncbi:MAG: hypothetical protein JXX28_17995 [Deltaproteobacteria bacterium]|nr:hypothetical protein [Deltaproteobacteria bacterium]
MNRRLGPLPYAGLVLLVLVLGGVGAAQAATLGPLAVWGSAFLSSWLLAPLVVMRQYDLGRSPDDAVWTVLPVLGHAFALYLILQGTPSDAARTRSLARWEGQVGALRAFGLGLRAAGRGALVVAPLVLVAALLDVWMLEDLKGFLGWSEELPLATREGLSQAMLVGIGVLGLYTALQVVKRKTVSRASWLPSLFLPPLLFLWGTVFMLSMPGSGPGRNILLTFGWGLLMDTVLGAGLAIAWIVLGEQLRFGRASLGGVVKIALRRLADVSGPHGARVLAVSLGMQVVVPGLYYAVQLALTDMAAVLEPDAPALSRSSRLTWGIRGRMLKILFLGVLLAAPLQLGSVVAFQGAEALVTFFTLPGFLPVEVAFLGAVGSFLSSAVVTLALLEVYRERVQRAVAGQPARAETAPVGAEDGEPLAAAEATLPAWFSEAGHLESLGADGLGALRWLAGAMIAVGVGLFAVSGLGWVFVGAGVALLAGSFALR